MIGEFQKIVNSRRWSAPGKDKGNVQVLEHIEERLKKRLMGGGEFSLTTLQKKAIGSPTFWREWDDENGGTPRHLMIQGATSAGKTLLAELNVLDTLQNDKKAVVLVPLKAMVRERTEQFRQDLKHLKNGCRVFGSSSDYMEDDERLIAGDYDVAIIVYEKFFAMLSQGNARIMNECGLLVVDELSMLSKEQRGPKLEMALEIVRGKHPQCRIMCLATCDCSTEKICRWLDIDDPIISAARPVALKEHILKLNGTGVWRLIPADHEYSGEADAPKGEEETIGGFEYDRNLKLREKKKKLLLPVIRKIYQETKDARVLVFVGSKADAAKLAVYLKEKAGELFPRIDRDQGRDDRGGASEKEESFWEKLNQCDRDEGQEMLISELIPYGIAYHHAGLSTTLRELIEEEFQAQNSHLKLIVATETLTVGVNMPFDAMVMVDSKVPHGSEDWEPLTKQEYRNYIGRAGRLGQSNRIGETYLFVENDKELDRYWESYCNREEVETALKEAGEDELAPYYLSLLVNRVVAGGHGMGNVFTEKQLEGLYDRSFVKICRKPGYAFRSHELGQSLCSAYLAQNADEEYSKRRRVSGEKADKAYAIENFGGSLAPYALSLDTDWDIHREFFDLERKGGFPLNVSEADIESDRYLLETLYHVCCHDEIKNASVLSWPSTEPLFLNTARQKILDKLECLLEEKDDEGAPRYQLWCDAEDNGEKEENELWNLQHGKLQSEDRIKALMRAILLFYWVQGNTVKEIKEKTGFSTQKRYITRVVSGDIERLAEAVSFHLDAIYRSFLGAEYISSKKLRKCATPEALTAFYFLQTRVKYGMPRDLVQLANKHIHGLDRARLLRLKKEAESCGMTPRQFLYLASDSQIRKIMTLKQKSSLLQALERRSGRDEFETLVSIVTKDVGAKLTDEARNALRTIMDWRAEDSEDSEGPEAMFTSLKSVLRSAFEDCKLSTDVGPDRINWEWHGHTVRIGLPRKDRKNSKKINDFFEEYTRDPHIIVVPESFDKEETAGEYKCDMVMSSAFLMLILLDTIRLDPDNGRSLMEFLVDARGIFSKSDYGYFALRHYTVRRRDSGDGAPRFRLLCEYSSTADFGGTLPAGDLEAALSNTEDLRNYQVLPWGGGLREPFAQNFRCPTVIYLERRQVTRSTSLSEFIALMRQEQFRNCLLLVDYEAAKEEWCSKKTLEGPVQCPWNSAYNTITMRVVTDEKSAVREVREFLRHWDAPQYLIGISYAHQDNTVVPEDARWASDVALTEKLAERLGDKYGTDRILFDRFCPAKYLFTKGRGQDVSLEAYGQCRQYLILWNYWTEITENCRAERETILARCGEGLAGAMFLTCGHSNDPKELPKGYFTTMLSEETMDDILERIEVNLADWEKPSEQ